MKASTKNNADQWMAIIAIAGGSAIGAFVRQGLSLISTALIANPIWAAIVLSIFGAVTIGIGMGLLTTAKSFDARVRSVGMIALVAALGAYAASSMLDANVASVSDQSRLVSVAILHIALVVVVAALSFFSVQKLRSH